MVFALGILYILMAAIVTFFAWVDAGESRMTAMACGLLWPIPVIVAVLRFSLGILEK